MKNVRMCYIHVVVTEGKIENLKRLHKMRIFIYTIHFAYLKVYTHFLILNQVVAEKTLMNNVHMCYIHVVVTEGKIENLKR